MSTRRRLLGTSSRIFTVRLGGAALVFLTQAAIAQFWGAELLGEYLLVIATVNIVSVLLPLGLSTVGTYFASEYLARGKGHLLRSFLARILFHVGIATVVVYFAGAVFLGFVGTAGEIMQSFWIPTCLMAMANALIISNGAVMLGLKHPYAGYFGEAAFRPILVAAALVVCLFTLAPAPAFATMLWLIAVGYLVIALLHLAYSVRVVAIEVPLEAEPRAHAREGLRWWRFAIPWIVVVLGTDFFFDLDLLLLSGFLQREELAVFGVCTRIFAIVAFGLTATYGLITPDLLKSHAISDDEGFIDAVGSANMIATGFAAVMLISIVACGELGLTLFGEAFQAGHLAITVLALALLIRAIFGPAAMILSINNRPYLMMPAVVLGVATLLVANLILVPKLGLNGAAWAALAAQSAWTLTMWFTALRIAKVDVSLLPRLRSIVAPRLPTTKSD